MLPLIFSSPDTKKGGEIPDIWKDLWVRMLCVPYDNTMWLRYEALPLRAGRRSYDLTVLYSEDSREGILVGALDFDRWKNGIVCSATDANTLEARCGMADEGTHDTQPHGILRGAQVFVVTDSNVARLYSEKIGKLFPGAPVCVIPAGERHKNRTGLFRILDGMLNARLHRSSVVVAFGGGVVGDMAGLAAALYMRGTRIVQMPTTLLAQVDSSVGGKTAVDYRGVKNVIGAFYQPERVFCDPLFFETLLAREIRCGLGEVIKTGLLDETVGGAIRANTGRLRDLSFLHSLAADCVRRNSADFS